MVKVTSNVGGGNYLLLDKGLSELYVHKKEAVMKGFLVAFLLFSTPIAFAGEKVENIEKQDAKAMKGCLFKSQYYSPGAQICMAPAPHSRRIFKCTSNDGEYRWMKLFPDVKC